MSKRIRTSTHPVETSTNLRDPSETSTHPVETSTNLSLSETLTHPAVMERLEDARPPEEVQRDINILRLLNKEMNTALEKPCESQLYKSLDADAKEKHKKCLKTRHYNQRIVEATGPSEFPFDYELWESSELWKSLWKSHVLCQIRKSLYRDKRTVVTFGVLPDTIDRFVSDILKDESMKCIIRNFTVRIYVMNRETPPKEHRRVYRGVIDTRDFSKEKDCIQMINTLKKGLKNINKETEIENDTEQRWIDAVQIAIGPQACDKHSVYNFTDKAYKSVQIIGYQAFGFLTGLGFSQSDTLNLSIFTALTHIGTAAFCNVTIKPDFSNLARLTYIGKGAFFSLKITPDFSDLVGLTEIGDLAFFNVKQVPNFEHLRKLTTIGYSAFESVSEAEAGEPGDSPNFSNLVELTHIKADAFKNCKFQKQAPDFTNLKKLRYIGPGAFKNAKGTPDFENLKQLKYIGSEAFANITMTETMKNQVLHLIKSWALEEVAGDAFPHVDFFRAAIAQALHLRRIYGV